MSGEVARQSDATAVVADATARALRFPSPAQNQRIFRVDTKKHERYSGSSWVVDPIDYADIANAPSVDAAFGNNTITTTGLTYGYNAGMAVSAGVPTRIAAGTVLLTDNASNYVERTYAGVVSANAVAFTATSIPMAVVTTVGGVITTIVDYRTAASPVSPFPVVTSEAGVVDVRYPVGDVRRYGAVDGAADNSTAVQRAFNQALIANSARVYFPAGTWTFGDVVAYSNTIIEGDGWKSHLVKKSGKTYLISVNSGTGGTTNVSGNQRNITIRSLWAEGLSASAFSQFHHLINLNAVSDVLVEECQFTSFEGDAIYVGSSNVAATERHNERVTIRKNRFDGVNKENRNAISIIDCDTFTIEDNDFTRCSKSTMPGAIDIEPDANAFAVIKKGRILNNRFYDIGGNYGAIGMLLPLGQAALTTPQTDLLIEGNTIDTCAAWGIALVQTEVKTNTSVANNVRVLSNTVLNASQGPWQVQGMRGVVIDKGVYRDCAHESNLGTPVAATATCKDIKVLRNTSERVGTTSGYGLVVFTVDRFDHEGNHYIDCGQSGGGFGIGVDFNTGTSTYVTMADNRYSSPAGKTLVGVQKEAGHTFTTTTNIERGTQLLDAVATNSFVASSSGGFGLGTFDSTTLPDSFTTGLSVSVVNGDAGVPNQGGQQGLLETHKGDATTPFRKFARQFFYPAFNTNTGKNNIFTRSANSGANTWSAWSPIDSGTFQSVTYTSGGTSAIDALIGDTILITITDNAAGSVIGFPSNLWDGARLEIHVLNSSGGGLTNLTFAAGYHLGAALTLPANGLRKVYAFSGVNSTTVLYEKSRSGDLS